MPWLTGFLIVNWVIARGHDNHFVVDLRDGAIICDADSSGHRIRIRGSDDGERQTAEHKPDEATFEVFYSAGCG